jgi:uncharacterized integral membrane protein
MSRAPADLDRACRQAQLIGGALVLAIGTYAFVVEMLRTNQAPFLGFSPRAPLGLLRLVFAIVTVVILVVVNVVRKQMVAGPAAGRAPLPQRLLTASIVALAMCEAIAIYGLVLFLLGGQRADFYGFAALALVGFAVYFPRRSQWEAWAQQA